MDCKYSWESEQVSSVDAAADYAARMVSREAGSGDVEAAMRRVEAKTGVNYWTLWALRYRRPKTIAADLFHRIRGGAYLSLCERELSKLQHELAVEQAKGDGDDLSDLAEAVSALASKVDAAVARRRAPKG